VTFNIAALGLLACEEAPRTVDRISKGNVGKKVCDAVGELSLRDFAH
jgi:hypothetical protein